MRRRAPVGSGAVAAGLLALAGGPAHAAPPSLVAAARLDRIEADLDHLVHGIGPRPPGSAAEQAAARHVARSLAAVGWTVETVGMPGNQVACRGRPERLVLAHVDTVDGAPGAVDNGAGVALVLELARDPSLSDLCVAFPVAEEAGLVGSRALAEAAAAGVAPFDGLPAVAVATELRGQGRLAVMGLGPPWGDQRLAWLAETLDPLPAVPYPYRVYSRLLPWAERSDHGPFLERGVPGLLLLGQGPGEVYPHYHQPSDDQWDRAALGPALVALDQLMRAPLPPDEGEPAPWTAPVDPVGAGVFVWGWRLPGALVLALIGAALGAGAVGAVAAPRQALGGLPRQLATGVLGALVGGLLMAAATSLGLLAPGAGEAAAAATMGLAPTGWWTGAPLATGLGLAGLLGIGRWLGPRGHAPVAGALCVLLALGLGPVFALPFAVGALLSWVHPWLALVPVLVLLRPDGLRQLSFHGLLPPAAWGAVLLLGWPAVGARRGAKAAGPRDRPG